MTMKKPLAITLIAISSVAASLEATAQKFIPYIRGGTGATRLKINSPQREVQKRFNDTAILPHVRGNVGGYFNLGGDTNIDLNIGGIYAEGRTTDNNVPTTHQRGEASLSLTNRFHFGKGEDRSKTFILGGIGLTGETGFTEVKDFTLGADGERTLSHYPNTYAGTLAELGLGIETGRNKISVSGGAKIPIIQEDAYTQISTNLALKAAWERVLPNGRKFSLAFIGDQNKVKKEIARLDGTVVYDGKMTRHSFGVEIGYDLSK